MRRRTNRTSRAHFLRLCLAATLVSCLASISRLKGDDPSQGDKETTRLKTPENIEQDTLSPIYLSKTASERANLLRSRPWIETIAKEVPPLRHASQARLPADRMPMIMWHGVGFQPLTREQIDILRRRGLCQHLQLTEAAIPAAKALAAEGMPIILMEGRTDSWPYSLADDLPGIPGDWAHQFDLTFQPPWFGTDDSSQWHGACPHRVEGWTLLERQTEATMRKFEEAGICVDAVLIDYEGDPYPWSHLFDQLRHCRRCRRELPHEVVHDKSVWRDYAWKQYVDLYDKHFAQPIRHVFPDALVTNWHIVFSSTKNPVRYFAGDVYLPELRPQHFSATNPIAYASDTAWRERWNPANPLSQRAVDDFYAREIIHQVDSDRRNREQAGATSVKSIPWVARVCRILEGESSTVPIMSRQRYRESLGDVWEQGVHGMQIFNPMHDGYEELAVQELQDAVVALDESLSAESMSPRR